MAQCLARLYLADDYGDNSGTYKCQLEEGHEGPYQEVFNRKGLSGRIGKVVISWDENEGESFYFKDRFFSDSNKSVCKRLDGLTMQDRDVK